MMPSTWKPFLSSLGVFLALGLLYVVGVITYRLTFHPLAKYPGPLLGRITDWYSVVRSARGDRHLHLLQLHEKHGTFVRFGPNRMAVNTAEGLRDIYGARANTNKSSYYHVVADAFGGHSSSTTIDQETHVRKKRVVSGALSEKSLRGMEELVLRNIDRFVTAMGPLDSRASAEWSSPKDMAEWCGYLSFDIMGDVCFSSSFDMVTKEENRFLLQVLARGVNGLDMTGYMPSIRHLGKLFFAGTMADVRRYHDFANRQSTRRLALGEEAVHADVYSHVIAANQEKKPLFTAAELVSESALLITAGSDTSSVAMAATLFYLLHNPHKLKRLESEIVGAAFSKDEAMRPTSIGELGYLRACIDEAMRMSPPVPGLPPRVALRGGVTVGGEHFAAGTDLGVSHYALNHNEAVYPDSFAYVPERWLAEPMTATETREAALDRVRTAQSAYCAFSVGPRACVGKALAIKEMMVTLARLVWTYEMRLAPGHEHVGSGTRVDVAGQTRGEYQLRDMFIAKGRGPVVQFRKRVSWPKAE